MIDWHSHMLPGLDDGPETMAESLAMARLLVEAGVHTVYCTPHCIRGRYDNSPDQVRRATERFQRELLAEGIRLAVKPGMEYHLDEHFPEQLENPQFLGNTRLLLVEIPSRASVDLVRENLRQILRRGHVPLLAHPERSALLTHGGCGTLSGRLARGFRRLGASLPGGKASNYVFAGEALLSDLTDMGCRFQGNLPSFTGWYGPGPQQQALHNLAGGLYSCLGSDGHGVKSLKQFLKPALSVLKGFPVAVLPPDSI
jgi:protein-tyrosine phosphatase